MRGVIIFTTMSLSLAVLLYSCGSVFIEAWKADPPMPTDTEAMREIN